MSALIKKCNCHSPFQDKEYGEGMRVFNENLKMGASCTVCGTSVKTDIPLKKITKK